jgi:uncharacterized protein (DUF1501 family)
MSVTQTPSSTSDVEVELKPCGCPHLPEISRRSFLKASAAGIVAGLATEGMFTRLAFADTPYAGDVLVVLSLRGGMDGLNAIVPSADPDYPTWRPNIGIGAGALIALDPMFGMHHAMASLKPLWDAGTFGVVHAVGMDQPNRSHFQAMEEMERAAPGTSVRTGWLDRVLGLRDPGSAFQASQIGSNTPASAFLGPSPELAMWSVDSFGLDGAWDDTQRGLWDSALRGLYSGAPDVLVSPTSSALDALSTTAQLKADGYTPANGAIYPSESGLADALRDIARLIKADVGLQVAAVDYGDWDMHSGMGDADRGWMHDHLTELSTSLAAFATDLGSKLDDVSLVSLTEFGRRVEENGSGGVDHGFGQAVLLLGGGIKGGHVHGQWPGLAAPDLIDGDLNGVNDYRKVLAELLEKRCGAGSVGEIFPGLGSERYDIATQRS